MKEIEFTIDEEEIGDPTDDYFEEGAALALLITNDLIVINSNWWRVDLSAEDREKISIGVVCNDVFGPGADAVILPFHKIKDLYQRWRADPEWGAVKWCCIQNECRPRDLVIDRMKHDGAWCKEMEKLGGSWNAEQQAVTNSEKSRVQE